MGYSDVLTIAIQRRQIAIASFAGVRLDYLQVRELSADQAEAGRTTQRFVEWAAGVFNPKLIVIEVPPGPRAARRIYLHAVVRGTLLQHRARLIDVEPGSLKALLAEPKLRSRKQAREVAGELWPQLSRFRHQPAAHDAALIGIHVQMADLFNE